MTDTPAPTAAQIEELERLNAIRKDALAKYKADEISAVECADLSDPFFDRIEIDIDALLAAAKRAMALREKISAERRDYSATMSFAAQRLEKMLLYVTEADLKDTHVMEAREMIQELHMKVKTARAALVAP